MQLLEEEIKKKLICLMSYGPWAFAHLIIERGLSVTRVTLIAYYLAINGTVGLLSRQIGVMDKKPYISVIFHVSNPSQKTDTVSLLVWCNCWQVLKLIVGDLNIRLGQKMSKLPDHVTLEQLLSTSVSR